MHASLVARRWAGDVVVPDDVCAVKWDAVLGGQVAHQRCRSVIHILGIPGRALDRIALVLDPDRVTVEIPVACVPGDVLGLNHLCDMAVE